ncbi:hypothetical protein [Vibrio sp. F13]|uniref:hypothetical protein n=1 Tax=Vibrio sp. F13 TaxID=2070777 RepID=UPI0010BD51F2|nr:hypothetical protein [Vibrio sp. F13]TKF99562.1 hypothetical protein FCV76_18385 [Vibrio sp. F13]
MKNLLKLILLVIPFTANAQSETPFTGNLKCENTTYGYIGTTETISVTTDAFKSTSYYSDGKEMYGYESKIVDTGTNDSQHGFFTTIYLESEKILIGDEIGDPNRNVTNYKQIRIAERKNGDIDVYSDTAEIKINQDILSMTQHYTYSCKLAR